MLLMNVECRNPPKTFTLLLDTGSSITWVEHADCIECINGDAPPWTGYDEAVSSTSEIIYCDKNRKCNMATNAFCKRSRRCEYSLKYISGDCKGFYFSDTLYMDADGTRADVFEGFIFGGSLQIRGELEEHTHGIFGLGNATGSFIFQEGLKRLSFCLPPSDSPQRTKLLFEDEARMIGKSLPMIKDPDGHYVVRLIGISVDDDYLDIEARIFRGAGGTGGAILDTGAPLSVLPKRAYGIVVDKLTSIINLPLSSKPKSDRLCFNITGETEINVSIIPSMMLHFERLNLPISRRYLFAKTQDGDLCLNIRQYRRMTIIGIPFLQNINIGIDLDRNRIFMQPLISCTTI
ncbi:aspartic proteinase CDR1-like protein [Carex littledalei]|uniref:Aspartic proteinase CDR1-like protein n=1 Tax=Carex littledalei TaxID=544730 RepID=A0A833V2T5_9POAL|nr:aspartic proteinase CDR1-like protein [Carex littledalei]